MASITGINSYLYNDYNNFSAIGVINTSTEKFKGTVTGYKPVEKSSERYNTSALSAEETRSYMSDLKDFGSKLKTALGNVTNQSVFSKVTASSSKDEVLSVSVGDQEEGSQWADPSNSKNVTVGQLATAQKNTGATLTSMRLSGANTGANQFTIERDGKNYDFTVNINATDSARTAQEKMADAINKQNAGITASVVYDEKSKASTLVLSSAETGQKNAFTIEDTEGRGNLVSALGVAQASQEAQDAQYTVDGTTKTSDKNTVDLGNGITGTLKKTSAEAVTVGAQKDIAGISSALNEVVNSYNSLMETTQTYGDDKGAQALRQRLDSIASSYASSLQKIGISQDKDGYLKIDDDKMKAAFESGAAEKYLGDSNAGFTQRLSQLANSVDSNPDQFVSYRSRNHMDGVSASTGSSGGGYNTSYSDYLSAYRTSQLSNLGMLFDTGV